MKKVLITLILCSSIFLPCIVQGHNDLIQAREYFKQNEYQISYDNSSKTASFINLNTNIKILFSITDNIINFNNIVYFSNNITVKDNYIYIPQKVIEYITKLNKEPEYSEAKSTIEPTENNISYATAEKIAAEFINKFYNISTDNYNINTVYYDNNTCGVMFEKNNNILFVTLNSITGKLINIDRTINKNDYANRSTITKEKLSVCNSKICNFLSKFNTYNNLEIICNFIPKTNNSTLYSFFKDTYGNYYTIEYLDNTLEPISFYSYTDIDTAFNEITKYF